MAEELLLTQAEYDKLVEEHDYLITVRRQEVAEHLKYAKSQGDLSENADYDAAKDENAEVETRINKLDEMIRLAKVVNHEELSGDTVNLGLTAQIKDLDYGDECSYTIVGITAADPLNGKISNESPVGKALIGKKVGDKVEVIIESKEGGDPTVLHFEILGITKE